MTAKDPGEEHGLDEHRVFLEDNVIELLFAEIERPDSYMVQFWYHGRARDKKTGKRFGITRKHKEKEKENDK